MKTKFHRPSISAFFPAYNDSGTIADIVTKAIETLRELTDDYEVVVVDDGSMDETGNILDGLSLRYKCLKVIHHKRNRGYGGALITGFSNVTKELVFYTDGDGQYDVAELKRLLSKLTEGVDIVNGYKISRSDPLYRVVIGRCYQVLMRILFGLKIRDVDCDFRLFRRNVFDRVKLTSRSGVICVEMMKKMQELGFNMVEVPVHHYHRSCGRSQFFCFKHLSAVAWQLVSLWWRLMVLRDFAAKDSASLADAAKEFPLKRSALETHRD